MSNPTITFTFTVAPTDGDHWNNPCVWSYANTVGYTFLEYQDQPKADGPLTADERGVFGKIITSDLKNFETVWGDVASTHISDAELETNPDYATVMPKAESSIMVAWECHVQHANGLITLVYQKSGMASVLSQLSSWAAYLEILHRKSRVEYGTRSPSFPIPIATAASVCPQNKALNPANDRSIGICGHSIWEFDLDPFSRFVYSCHTWIQGLPA